jgi:type I restriction enzyme S subunit
MSFEWCRLESLAASQNGSIAIGPFGSRMKSDCYTDSGVAIIRGTNLSGSCHFSGEFVFVSDEKAKELGNANVSAGDLVFPHRGNIGAVGLVPDDGTRYALSSSLMKITLDTKRALPAFYYYFFRSQCGQAELLKNASQVGTPGIATPLTSLRSCMVPCTPMDQQIAAAAILSSLDDRIALLRESNATLEAIAQALFKSWFVDFDPVRAKAEDRMPEGLNAEIAGLFPSSFEESELGESPTGWRAGTLGDLAQTARAQRQPSDFDASIHYVGLEHIPRGSLSLTDWGNAAGLESAKSCFQEGDILFGKLRPYFHKVVVAPFNGVCSTDILVCQPKIPAFYGVVAMHLFSKPLIDYADRLSNGAKMPRVNWKDLAAYPIVLPPEPLAECYRVATESLVQSIVANVHKAKTLADLRDTLLPRLVSGQLRLPEAEALLQDAA